MISDGAIYVAGSSGGSGGFWNNGVWSIIQAYRDALVRSIAVHGSDVYVTGLVQVEF